MLHNAMNWLRRLVSAEPRKPKPHSVHLTDRSASNDEEVTTLTEEHIGSVISYDEHLLERARTQWQFGDWQSLAAIERSSLELHPDRAKLALLAAAGHAQVGASEEARLFFQLAREWGCSKQLLSQVLISGVHNSLGCAAILMGQEQRALTHLNQSVAIGTPGSDTKLLTQARAIQQCRTIGTRPPSLILELKKTI